jgi:UDP-N-acetylglucosamine 1-carboxyvinyltransferase
MAASTAKGKTRLYGCAREPEIVDLADALNKMGAKISGAGTGTIEIDGVGKLHAATVTPIPDRIAAATYLAGAALTGGEVVLENVRADHLTSVLENLKSPHVEITEGAGTLTVKSDGIILPTDIVTAPYPGFPTDMQSVFMALQCFAQGTSQTTETIYENRFSHAAEFAKMGAKIQLIDKKLATVYGFRKISGADMTAGDLRGGAGLVNAALAANGTSRVYGAEYIDRGYEKIEDVYASLGAKISRRTQE